MQGWSAAQNRLNIEYKEIKREDSKRSRKAKAKKAKNDDSIVLMPSREGNLFDWKAFVKGPPDSPYEGGVFELRLQVSISKYVFSAVVTSCSIVQVPQQYPLKPPRVHFKTKVCHPNVLFKDAWTPVWTLETTCRAIVTLLGNVFT
eukprot:1206999-Amorphochlora_amoeboformis.AAC.1